MVIKMMHILVNVLYSLHHLNICLDAEAKWALGSGKCGLYSNQGIQHKNVLGCTALGTASTALQTKSLYIHAFQLFKSLKKKIQTF